MGADLLAHWLPAGGVTDEALPNTLYGAVLGGISTGLAYRGHSTMGGTGIINHVVQLRTGMPINQVYIIVDGVIILSEGIVFG